MLQSDLMSVWNLLHWILGWKVGDEHEESVKKRQKKVELAA